MTIFTSGLILIGIAVGVISFKLEKLFLVVLFLGLPLLAYFSQYITDFNPYIAFNNDKPFLENAQKAFLRIPNDLRFGVAFFIPAFVVGRTIAIMTAARRNDILSPENLRKRKPEILRSYGIK